MSVETESDSDRHGVTLREWNQDKDLLLPLLTFDYRIYDPFEVVASIRNALADLPETAATWRLTRIKDDLPIRPTAIAHLTPIVELAGAWRHGMMDDSRGKLWVNPNYVHAKEADPNVRDTERRLRILRRTASYGTIRLDDVAPRFGLTSGSIKHWLSRRSIPWQEWRHDGISRIARTCWIVSKWGDHSITEMAAALGVPRGTLDSWIHKRARKSKFEVPPDPSGEPWFNLKSWETRSKYGLQ